MKILLPELLAKADRYAAELPPEPEALPQPQGADLAGWIDQTLLRPEATAAQVSELCTGARQYGFATVCVNPAYVPLAHGLLKDSPVRVCTVISFPLGADLPDAKALAARLAIAHGAGELDLMINLGALKSGAYALVLNEVESVVREAKPAGAKVKLILETALLNEREKVQACLLAQAAEADFVKTSTGFGPGGATVEDVRLMRRVVGPGTGVKASDGIRTLEQARAMIAAGASRIGTSSGVEILTEALQIGVTA